MLAKYQGCAVKEKLFFAKVVIANTMSIIAFADIIFMLRFCTINA